MFSHFLPAELDVMIVYSLSEWNGYVIHVWVYLQQRNHSSARDVFSENSLTQFWCSVEQSYSNLTMLLFHCLLPLFSTFCEHWTEVGFRGKANERRSPRFPPIFNTVGTLSEFRTYFLPVFFTRRPIFFKWPNKQVNLVIMPETTC